MAKTIAPLLSFDASGQIAKSQVYSTWKGVKYARRYTIPANPKTPAQVAQRELFMWVHDAYKYLDGAAQASWVEYSKGKTLTPANVWQQKNLVALKGKTIITDINFIVPVNGAPPNQSTSLAPGSGTIQATGVPPSIASGWTIDSMIAVCMVQQDPHGEKEPNPSLTMTKTAAPWNVTFTGLLHSQAYVVGIGWKFLTGPTSVAFGGSINAVGTTT